MAKQSAIQKNINRKVLIDRLSEKRKKLKSLLSNKDLPCLLYTSDAADDC